MGTYPYRTYVEIDLTKLEHNINIVKNLIGNKCKIMAVLKADAYGHGAEMCVQVCDDLIDWYGVATFQEGILLREQGTEKPILIFGPIDEKQFDLALQSDLTLSVFSISYAELLEKHFKGTQKRIKGHIKIDTGLNRTGITCGESKMMQAVIDTERILNFLHIQIQGIYTHLACPDSIEEEDVDFTQKQFNDFLIICNTIKQKGYDIGLQHCCSSSATLLYPKMHLDMVRIGMLPFGQSFSEESIREYDLRPILNWKSKVVQIKDIDKGESVSYGRIFRAERPMRIAIVSVGYADGYKRSYSNQSKVIVNGKIVPILGKVCMDFIMIDITDVKDVNMGTLVTLLGVEGNNFISANYLADLIGSVSGDITSSISWRVPRIYIKNGKEHRVVCK